MDDTHGILTLKIEGGATTLWRRPLAIMGDDGVKIAEWPDGIPISNSGLRLVEDRWMQNRATMLTADAVRAILGAGNV